MSNYFAKEILDIAINEVGDNEAFEMLLENMSVVEVLEYFTEDQLIDALENSRHEDILRQYQSSKLETLREDTLQWSHDRGILTNGKPTTQALKLVSEVGELCDNIAKGADCKDDIGDCLVVLTNISALLGYSLEECWEHAYNDIKDRQGFLNEHGNFIKSTDPRYVQLKLEFDNGKAV